MRRRRRAFDENQEVGRWLISYADFMTLLFAFFVVMYSISQVSETKYKILSDALVEAFDTPAKSLHPIQIGNINQTVFPVEGQSPTPTEDAVQSEKDPLPEPENLASSEEFKELENDLRNSLDDLIKQDLASITSDPYWININLRSGLLFPSGDDKLNAGVDPLIDELVRHLNSNEQLILVHGHTDNIPISSERFPSNWELSSARAVAVVRKLQNKQVYPPRMSVEGHGEYQPVAANDSAEGRSKNRRVVISISRKQRVSKLADDKILTPAVGEQGVNEQAGSKNGAGLKKDVEPQFNIIRLPGGGILIRGKDLPQKEAREDSQNRQNGQNTNDNDSETNDQNN